MPSIADILAGLATPYYPPAPPEQPWQPPPGSTFLDQVKGALRQDPGAVFTTGAEPWREIPRQKNIFENTAALAAGSNRFDPLELILGLGGGASGGALAGMPPLSFSERMALGRELASRRANAPAHVTARAPVVDETVQPLLAPGETRGDLARALTPPGGLTPVEPSVADIGREAYRGTLRQPPPEVAPAPKTIAATGKQAYDDALLKAEFEAERKPTTEMTPIGEQYVLPGAEQRPKGAAQKKADEPMRPTVAQKPADEGLFAPPDTQLGLDFDLTRGSVLTNGVPVWDLPLARGRPANFNRGVEPRTRMGEPLPAPESGEVVPFPRDLETDAVPKGTKLSRLAAAQEGEQTSPTTAGAPTRPPQITKTSPEVTVDSPRRVAAPGIYSNPMNIVATALGRIAPEHPALSELFGVSREDLAAIALARKGNLDPYTLLPGWKPGGGSEAAQAVTTPRNAQRLIDTLSEALKIPELRNTVGWYVMDPAYQRLADAVGHEQARKIWTASNTITGMASPGSSVEAELARGTAASMAANEGKFNIFQKYGGLEPGDRPPRAQRLLGNMPGHIYHSTAQAPSMADFLKHGTPQLESPKVPLYIASSGVPQTGFQTKLPVIDTHIAGSTGAWDALGGEGFRSSPKMPVYQTIAPWYAEQVAKPLGLEAGYAQPLQWTTYGPFTDVRSLLGAPKLELLAKAVWEKAQTEGMDPFRLLDLVLQRKAHLSPKR